MGLFSCCSSSAVDERAYVAPIDRDAAAVDKELENVKPEQAPEVLDVTATEDSFEQEQQQEEGFNFSQVFGSHLTTKDELMTKVDTVQALAEAPLVLVYSAAATDCLELTHKLAIFAAGYVNVPVVYCSIDETNEAALQQMPAARWYGIDSNSVDKSTLAQRLHLPITNEPCLVVLYGEDGHILVENAIEDIQDLDEEWYDYDDRAQEVLYEWLPDAEQDVVGRMVIPLDHLERKRLQHEIDRTEHQIHVTKKAYFETSSRACLDKQEVLKKYDESVEEKKHEATKDEPVEAEDAAEQEPVQVEDASEEEDEETKKE